MGRVREKLITYMISVKKSIQKSIFRFQMIKNSENLSTSVVSVNFNEDAAF